MQTSSTSIWFSQCSRFKNVSSMCLIICRFTKQRNALQIINLWLKAFRSQHTISTASALNIVYEQSLNIMRLVYFGHILEVKTFFCICNSLVGEKAAEPHNIYTKCAIRVSAFSSYFLSLHWMSAKNGVPTQHMLRILLRFHWTDHGKWSLFIGCRDKIYELPRIHNKKNIHHFSLVASYFSMNRDTGRLIKMSIAFLTFVKADLFDATLCSTRINELENRKKITKYGWSMYSIFV